jgi:hypothetical protein
LPQRAKPTLLSSNENELSYLSSLKVFEVEEERFFVSHSNELALPIRNGAFISGIRRELTEHVHL